MLKLPRACLSILVLVGAVACTNEADAERTLVASGYSRVQLTGWSFHCGDYETADGFRALNPVGLAVEGTVCCGVWTKGCTVRF